MTTIADALTDVILGCLPRGATTMVPIGGRVYFKNDVGLVVDHVDAAEFACALLLALHNTVGKLRAEEARAASEQCKCHEPALIINGTL